MKKYKKNIILLMFLFLFVSIYFIYNKSKTINIYDINDTVTKRRYPYRLSSDGLWVYPYIFYKNGVSYKPNFSCEETKRFLFGISSTCNGPVPIIGADPQTFQIINNVFSKDKENAYPSFDLGY